MHRLTITGASDDLIEIDGDIREEFNHYTSDDNEQGVLAVSDGTLLRVLYDKDGLWRFQTIVGGLAALNKVEGDAGADRCDVVELTWDRPFTWVAFGEQYRVKGK